MRILINRESPQPLYVQLENIFRHKLEDEEWQTNSMIPSENELCRIYGVSRMTIRSVLNRLVNSGLLYRVNGKGTFVSEPKIISKPLSQMGIREQLEQMGYETKTKLLSIEKAIASNKVAKELKLLKNKLVYIVKRIRYVKDEPLSYHTSYIPIFLCPDIEEKDLEHSQLCNILEEDYNYEIIRIIETLESVTSTRDEEDIFSLDGTRPLLLLCDTSYTHGNMPIEYSRVLFRGDKIKLELEFNKEDPCFKSLL